ncbi:MAG: PBP1A family penicillin-binding protein [Betaproteobacteria bacterium]|nr:PBP1A family penicillin-binding protein [Betaproteobacteria bacterium]
MTRWNTKKATQWAAYSLAGLVVLIVIGLATLITLSVLIWPKLPDLDTLTDYRPRVPLRVYTADGFLIREIGEERRAPIKIENVPLALKHALLAAEDTHFYEHMGVDFAGIARAALANLRSGRSGQGASTITMQVARNFFLTRDRTITRKLYEILLALKIEHNLSKDQILALYINQIYLGQRAYGFEVAAQTYFGKSLGELSLAETAMLAGLPKGPSTMNPIVNPKRAKSRQGYVLGRMRDLGYIDEAAYKVAIEAPLQTASGSAARDPSILSPVHAEYVAEMARQMAISQFGEQATQRGMKVYTTITRAEQEAAYDALRQGVMDYDRRHGYRGPEKYITLPNTKVDAGKISDEFAKAIDDELAKTREGDEQTLPDYGDLLLAAVIDASPDEVTVYRNGELIKIAGNGLSFASPMLKANSPQTKRVRRGALVRIRNGGGSKGWELTQVPEVDAALVSVDSKTGAVRALVGGFDFNRSQFNNVTMAKRQPGSSFKPFIYSASLEREGREYAPGSLIPDEPLYYPAGVTGKTEWEPKNYDRKFAGMMTMRDALARSKNIPIIRVLEDITPDYARGYIANFGFNPDNHPPYLTMALGAGSASPWDMATAYAVFANGGYRINPFVVKEIRDVNDNTLASFNSQVAGEDAPRVIDARNAWIMDSMLRDVVSRGTGSRARVLNRRDIAGKTGTTNDYSDAWFCGYNPTVVAVTWIGFPTPRNMGSGETGGTAALPMWINYMRVALANVPETFLPRPDGISMALAGEGDHEDYYYTGRKPPELLSPVVDDTGLLQELVGIPSNAQNYVPPAPVPQTRPSNQTGQPPRPPGEAPSIPFAKPEDVTSLGELGY